VPKWVSTTSTILLGWNIAVLAAFFFTIGVGLALREINDPISSDKGVIILLALAGCVGLSFGMYLGNKTKIWFRKQKQTAGYIYLIILVCYTIFSFPASFGYFII